jgi:hypothetical protein
MRPFCLVLPEVERFGEWGSQGRAGDARSAGAEPSKCGADRLSPAGRARTVSAPCRHRLRSSGKFSNDFSRARARIGRKTSLLGWQNSANPI